MPHLALFLCCVWFVSLFLFRSVLQWRRTGSTGIKGFHGRIGSTEWLAGLAAGAGLILAPLSPLATLLGWPGGTLVFEDAGLHLAGAGLASLGILGALAAQLHMGDSWRVGVDDTETTPLVTGGLFAYVRNPIFTFIGVSLLGFVLLVPSPFSMATLVLTFVGIQLQVRAVEEPYLQAHHGDRYARYAAAVGRFVPGFGKLAGDTRQPGASAAR